MRLVFPVLALLATSCGGEGVQSFLVKLPAAPAIALTNVRVIDGTGQPARDNQTIVIEGERITSAGPSSATRLPAGAHVVDLARRTVFPGLVGVHNHLFYHMGSASRVVTPQASFAKLYLASGVTTIRTAGAVDFYGDRRIKELIDTGEQPGPSIHLTAPYLHTRTGEPDPARVTEGVNTWAERGATSFKAYTSLRKDELKAAIDAAHALGLKVTGHLCAVGFQEAAGLGIDNLEHGLLADTEFYSAKEPDVCPDSSPTLGQLQYLDISGPAAGQLISTLVRRGVTITSTLAVYETLNSKATLDARTLLVLAPTAQDHYRTAQTGYTEDKPGDREWRALLRKEMEFERAFVAAGGRLAAGNDPTGWGGIVAGFGDQRQVELLVEAGFTPEQAIRIATANGAALLNESQIGTISPGMQADLVVVSGNPSARISDIRNIEMVFRKGTAYDPAVLIASTHGTVGAFDPGRYVRSPIFPIVVVLFLLVVAKHVRRRFRSAAA